MRWLLMVGLLPWAAAAAPEGGAPLNPQPLQLVLGLCDGSCIIGTPGIDRLEMEADYAHFSIPLGEFGRIELSGTDGTGHATLRNGDRLSIKLAAAQFSLKTLFGQADIPVGLVRNIRVSGVALPLPSGLALRYTFDTDEGDHVTDRSGNGNDGKVRGATFTRDGKVGGGMSFSGDQQAIDAGNPASLQMQDFTIMAWVKRGDPDRATIHVREDGNDDAIVFGYGRNGYALGLHPNGNLFLTKVDVDNVAINAGVHDREFHHVAVTKQGAKVVFYRDGVAFPAEEYDTNFEFGTNAAVGAREDQMTAAFYGVIDEVMVFNRPLSGEEIKGIYDSEK